MPANKQGAQGTQKSDQQQDQESQQGIQRPGPQRDHAGQGQPIVLRRPVGGKEQR